MHLRQCLAVVALGLGMTLPGAAAWAQDRVGYVLVTTKAGGGELKQARQDGMAVSRAMIGAGVTVIRRENADPANFAFGTVAPLTILYFSGPTLAQGGETWLLAPGAQSQTGGRPEGWPLSATVKALKARGALQVVVVIEGCHTAGSGFAELPAPPPAFDPEPEVDAATDAAPENAPPALPLLPRVDPLAETVFFLPADPAQGCPAEAAAEPRLTDRFLSALGSGRSDLAEAFAAAPGAGWADNRLLHRLPAPVAQVASTGVAAPYADRAALLRSLPPEQAEELAALWQKLDAMPRAAGGSGTILTTPSGTGPVSPLTTSSPVSPLSPVSPVSPLVSAPAVTPAAVRPGGGLRIVDVSARVLLAARPTAEGLPRPSVIVGQIAPTEAAFRPDEDIPLTPEEPQALTISGLSAEDRAAMRAEDATAFAALVESGAFDPPPGQLVAAIQAELQRMACYTARVDGQWGNGSRGAVDRYYAERGTQAPTREPTLVLWRHILTAEDVTCPAPVRAAAPAARTAPATTTRRTTPAATAPAAPAARTAPSGGIDAGALGRGVMR
ncbi:hypothetical protein SAMN05877809_105140 [Rhodobacter sp. JA431]|uniref:hypothetical protein n=1 Tax=Rhodobacter sp. JA431 TaxID=570013 RepID=UPI000BCC64FA|nr:hypothetical protein [Rhodobacter sp. JA431]SOC10540.1 hypothetical protein SAMN05877809_105140 [Rhodobacter sp. JA431]